MKYRILALFIVLSAVVQSQVKKNLAQGVSISFPSNPEQTVNEENFKGYLLISGNMYFQVSVHNNALPDYDKYLLIKDQITNEQDKAIKDDFYNYLVKESYEKDKVLESEINYKGYYGRFIKSKSYDKDNKATYDRYMRMFLINNDLIVIETGFFKETKKEIGQRDAFFNSLEIKE